MSSKLHSRFNLILDSLRALAQQDVSAGTDGKYNTHGVSPVSEQTGFCSEQETALLPTTAPALECQQMSRGSALGYLATNVVLPRQAPGANNLGGQLLTSS